MRLKWTMLLTLLSIGFLGVGSVQADESLDKNYQWKVPAGRYIDPTSFFSLHGYIDSVYGSFSRDWTKADPAQVPGPGQVLVPNSNVSGFQYDAALIVGTEIARDIRAMFESHWVSDPSGSGAAGPGGNTIVVTEAAGSWDLAPSYATLSAGIFWAPFGTVNHDWLGPQNLFTLIPRASAAFPTHWNERGLRLNGAKAFSAGFGANYVVSYGNGVQSWDIGGQSSFDKNENKTVMGRIGLFPGLGKKLEVGASFAAGQLRATPDLTKPVGDPTRSPAKLAASGIDVTYQSDDVTLRSYWINSLEKLGSIPGEFKQDNLNRNGFMAEAAYDITPQAPILKIKTFTPKVRFDWVDVQALTAASTAANHFKSAVYSVGLGLRPHDRVVVNLEYHIQKELSRPELSNNRFVGRLSFGF